MSPDDLRNLPRPSNLFDNLPARLPDELFTTLIQSPQVRIERIVSQAHASPEGFWYDQPQHEWVLLIRGAATLRFEEGLVELRSGDSLLIQAHRKHRVESTAQDQPTIWLAVHYDEVVENDRTTE